MVKSIIEKYGGKKRNKLGFETINVVEKKLEFKLPIDYCQFVEEYTGFDNFIGKEYVRLWGLEELIEANLDYQITDKLRNTIGIGTNGGGEFIGIESIEEKYRVVLSPLINLDPYYHIEIGVTFTDFLIRLDKGIEWFK